MLKVHIYGTNGTIKWPQKQSMRPQNASWWLIRTSSQGSIGAKIESIHVPMRYMDTLIQVHKKCVKCVEVLTEYTSEGSLQGQGHRQPDKTAHNKNMLSNTPQEKCLLSNTLAHIPLLNNK